MNENFTELQECRFCAGQRLDPVHSFGEQCLGSVFPLPDEPDPPRVPLDLERCGDCGLVQMTVTPDPELMYHDDYGYRSGTTATMREHLGKLARYIEQRELIDRWLDIGCNDLTLLRAREGVPYRVGIDPTVADGLTDDGIITLRGMYPDRRAGADFDVITTIAMLYDLDDPVTFVRNVRHDLADDGAWIVEFMDAQAMLAGAWDIASHEHLTVLSFADLCNIARSVEMGFYRVGRYPINGGSIRAGLVNDGTKAPEINAIPYERWQRWSDDVSRSIAEIIEAIEPYERVGILGASQKGNTILQACDLNADRIVAAFERMDSKVGRVTPGTRIPIVHEDDLVHYHLDALLVLPWQFQPEIIERTRPRSSVPLIFPLPKVKVVPCS